jgi:transcriptional regulator with XRE-family HTH domain
MTKVSDEVLDRQCPLEIIANLPQAGGIAWRIAEALRGHDLEKVAREIEVSEATLARWAHGDELPNRLQLAMIACVTFTDWNFLIGKFAAIRFSGIKWEVVRT